MDTKEQILLEALNLFAEKGYDAVGVAQIAQAVGIKAPSLYKHYKNKRDILESIISLMAGRYAETAAALGMDGAEVTRDEALFSTASEAQLLAMGRSLFLYFLHDEYASKFRAMLTIERYGNNDLAQLYYEQYIDAPLSYQGLMFRTLMQAGLFIEADSDIMALHFYAPLYLLLTMCDCDASKESYALALLEGHIKQFSRIYLNHEGGVFE